MQSGILTAEAGEYGKYIGVVELTFTSGNVTDATAKLIPIKGHEEDCGITPDAEVQAFIDEVNASMADYITSLSRRRPSTLTVCAVSAARARRTSATL